MKLTGIIAEYNPLHNGHIYHMDEARRLSGADGLVVVMSGDFVQRGEPAIIDKYLRTKAALMSGADAVFELPVRFACGSAGFFASGGVSVLNSLGAVTGIAFGCEDPDLDALRRLAAFLEDEPDEYRELLLRNLRIGMNYARARSLALEAVLPPSMSSLLEKPNNILAVEYLRAMARTSSSLVPYAVARAGQGHNESASAIRCALSKELPDYGRHAPLPYAAVPAPAVSSASPEPALARPAAGPSVPGLSSMLPGHMLDELGHPLLPDDFSALLLYRLRLLTEDELACFDDISPDLANAIKRASSSAHTFSELVHAVSSRTYTDSRIRRSLIHILLNLREEKPSYASQPNLPDQPGQPGQHPSGRPLRDDRTAAFKPAALRLLGFKKGTKVLRHIQDTASVPIITKTADAPKGSLDEDVLASDIYRLVYMERYGTALPDEYHRGPVII
jgi:predicted nucleotidyltransferase